VTMPVLWVVTGCPRSRRLPLRSESVPVPTKECYMLYWGDKKLWSIRVLYSIYYVYGTCCSVAGLTAVFFVDEKRLSHQLWFVALVSWSHGLSYLPFWA
jgi:hypothetical protein